MKRSLLTEGHGVPIGLTVAGANRHDMKLVDETINQLVVVRPEPTEAQNLCLDKGYGYQVIRDLLATFGFTAHIRSRGQEVEEIRQEAGKRAHRWVVERTHFGV